MWDGMRDEIRASESRTSDAIVALEGRMTGALETLRREAKDSAFVHAQLHIESDAKHDAAHNVFAAFIKNAELAEARRGGVLAVFRFATDTLGRNWKVIAVMLAGLLSLLGNIRISLVAQ